MDNLLLQREKELFKLNEEIDGKTKAIFNGNDVSGVNKKNKITRKMPTNKNQILKTSNQSNTKSPVQLVQQDSDSIDSMDGNSVNQETQKAENDCAAMIVSTTSISPTNLLKMKKKSISNSDIAKNSTENVIPKIFEKRNFSSEGLIKFLKSKASILQTELETAQKENCEYVKKINDLVESNKQAEAMKELLLNKTKTLEKTVTKFEEKNGNLEKKQKEQDTAFALLSKELDNTKSELKSTKHALQCFEKRFLKLQEELEATKVKLCAANDSEKIIRNTARLDRSSSEKQLRDLRRDKNSLSKDFKKQLILIGNLREELVRLEKQRLFEISDPDDIVKILNWKLEAEE